MSNGGKAWFEYDRTAGRFSAMPISWEGWVAVILLVALPSTALTLALKQVGAGVGPIGRLAVIVATMAAIAYAVVKLAIAKGRPRG